MICGISPHSHCQTYAIHIYTQAHTTYMHTSYTQIHPHAYTHVCTYMCAHTTQSHTQHSTHTHNHVHAQTVTHMCKHTHTHTCALADMHMYAYSHPYVSYTEFSGYRSLSNRIGHHKCSLSCFSDYL